MQNTTTQAIHLKRQSAATQIPTVGQKSTSLYTDASVRKPAVYIFSQATVLVLHPESVLI